MGTRILLYGCFFGGCGVLVYPSLQVLWVRRKMHRRLRGAHGTKHRDTWNIRWVEQALCVAWNGNCSVKVFWTVTSGLFLITIVFTTGAFSPIGTLLASICTASVPFGALWVALEKIRKKGSYEGEVLVGEVLRAYRVTERNLCETLERVLDQKTELPITGRLLFRLLLEFRATGEKEAIRRATNTLAFSLDTCWGRMLAYVFYIAETSGVDVSLALEDILIQLREARQAHESRKRLNSEAFRMAGGLIPTLYVASGALAVFYLDLPAAKWMHHQFGTREGLLFFFLIAFLFLFNLLVLTLIVHRKFDY